MNRENGTAYFKKGKQLLELSSFNSDISDGQNSNLNLNLVQFFSTTVLIRLLWELKTVASLHRCLMHALLLEKNYVLLTWDIFVPI